MQGIFAENRTPGTENRLFLNKVAFIQHIEYNLIKILVGGKKGGNYVGRP